jgi:protein Tex
MNNIIIKEISEDLKIKENQILATLKLLEEGNTIPFIARYRKEATNNLDEEQIRKISEVYEYQVSLLKRKEDVIRLIEEKGLMTEELKTSILSASKLVDVEDYIDHIKKRRKQKQLKLLKMVLSL